MKITIYKYDPSVDAEPYPVSGEIEFRDKMTGLEAVMFFHENIEAINFDYSCASRNCGRCSAMLNGEPVLLCVSRLENRDYTIKPLEGFPVIRDLIVDKSSLDNRLARIYDRVRLEPFDAATVIPANYDPAVEEKIYPLEFCCRCGVCSVKCPAMLEFPEEYIGPTGMIAVAYRYLDPLDQGDRIVEAVNNGLFRCIQCGNCDLACQNMIEHAPLWVMLREAAAERGLVPSYKK